MRRLVITFYSYKGGVGRTQALANIAVALANRGQDVVVLDMDLESPGLHAFFSPEDDLARRFTESDFAERAGLLDFLEHCQTLPDEGPDVVPLLVRCAHQHKRRGRIRLLPPGKLDDRYPTRLARFSWDRFYSDCNGYTYLELMRTQLFEGARADVVLIDSRTGLTDPGMVSTFQLPDVVLILFALHEQGIEGARRTARAVARRSAEDEGRPERVLLIPSRVDEYGEAGEVERWASEAQKQMHDIPKCEILRDFNQRIPYYPKVSYGEHVLDLDAHPNPLSVAYKNLAERLVSLQREPGPPSPSTPPPPPAEPLLPSLRVSMSRLKRGIDRLVADIEALRVVEERIREAPQRAHDVVYQQETLCAELQRLEAGLSDLDHLADTEAAERAPFPRPDSVQGWRGLAASLDSVYANAVERCLSAARERLIAAAHQDIALVDQTCPELERFFEKEAPEELAERLREAEERVKQLALRSLLKRGALSAEVFALRIPAEEGRRLWLDERIQEEIDRATEDNDAGVMLRNLLRLRCGVLDENEGLGPLWNAYDVACLLLRDAPGGDAALFLEVGATLWRLAWSRLFSAELSQRDVMTPAGLEAREQLQRIALSEPERLDPIVETVTRGLLAWVEKPYPERERALMPLFQARRDDPVLRASIAAIADRRPPSWREALAAWLVDCQSFEEEDHAALLSVLHDLTRENREAEAFYALCAIGRGDPRVLGDERFDDVLVAFTASLLMTGKGKDLLAQLFADFEFVRRMSARPAGRALLAVVKGRLSSLQATDGAFSATMILDPRRAFQGGTPLPESVIAWLSRPRHDPPYDGSSGGRIQELTSRIEEIGQRSIYAGWEGSSHYERHLRLLLEATLASARAAPRMADARRARLPVADEWIALTSRKLRDERAHFSSPTDTARNRIIEFFKDAQEAIDALCALCPEDGETKLEDLLQAKQDRDKAISDLRRWISKQIEADPSGALRKVGSLLEDGP